MHVRKKNTRNSLEEFQMVKAQIDAKKSANAKNNVGTYDKEQVKWFLSISSQTRNKYKNKNSNYKMEKSYRPQLN